jgi:hypothetical protein
MKPEEILSVEKGYRLTEVMPERDSFPVDSTIIYLGYTRNELVIYAKMWQKSKINASARKRDAESLFNQVRMRLIFYLQPKRKEIWGITFLLIL